MVVAQSQAPIAAPQAAEKRPVRKSLGRRITAAVIGIALAAAAVYAQTFALSFEQRTSSLTYKGRIGEVVATGRYNVKVASVTAAHAVDTQDYSDNVTKVGTSNLFLVVDVSATAAREPMQVAALNPPVLLTEDGRRYRPTDKVAQSLTFFNRWIQPGFWISGVLVFEVPKDAVPGARLVFIPAGSAIVMDNFAPEAEIDLGLSDEAGRRLISQAEDYHSLVSKKR
ncbi:DUF4352 domain-containing protein [Sphaerimonospora thailandensis]|uniref:DUF4352 domain-containing protein n=1 Tax=Sphaerimonospora thailandensis TaxID=795644 RepID=A0A8J3REZ2_9ACTN|nr:DUF4352 domain-containing protein [Sphaerimonospora thailandensis]GIH73041.1 hypothetical protein Mth01_52940 [Sphaerimonospora thailandensis]